MKLCQTHIRKIKTIALYFTARKMMLGAYLGPLVRAEPRQSKPVLTLPPASQPNAPLLDKEETERISLLLAPGLAYHVHSVPYNCPGSLNIVLAFLKYSTYGWLYRLLKLGLCPWCRERAIPGLCQVWGQASQRLPLAAPQAPVASTALRAMLGSRLCWRPVEAGEVSLLLSMSPS